MYHYIRAYTNQADQEGIYLSVSPATFKREMRYLRRHRYHTITLARLARHIRYGTPLPSNPVALTFDAWEHRDQFTKALPVLRHDHLTATFFIVSGFVDQPRYMTWRQVRTLSRDGMEIGVHTIHHLDLSSLTPWQDWREIHHSKVVIERYIGCLAVVFAYPGGEFNGRVLADVRKTGYIRLRFPPRAERLTRRRVSITCFASRYWVSYPPSTMEALLTERMGNPFEPTPTVP